jgi:orotate phosphoribosyltransferase
MLSRTMNDAKSELLSLLRKKSVFHGEFTLSSGGKSNYYVDCRLTTLDPQGAWLTGQVMHQLIRKEESARGCTIDAVGGLTLGADPVSLAIGMVSYSAKDPVPLRVFVVRKSAKAHGQTRLIEGNFKPGDLVVVVDDVVTRGESALAAISAVEKEGGKVVFVAALVDRQEGGIQNIEQKGYRVLAAFRRDELL